jgi:hypothetical protein
MTAVDATAQSALGDSAPVRDDFTGTEVDSLLTDFADFPSDSLLTDLAASDSVAVAPADSAAVQEKKKDALEDPVIYESTDSMTWMRGGSASLYGNGKVN